MNQTIKDELPDEINEAMDAAWDAAFDKVMSSSAGIPKETAAAIATDAAMVAARDVHEAWLRASRSSPK